MLREFHIHRGTDSSYFTDPVVEQDDEEVPFWKDGAPDDQPIISERLSGEQLRQLLSKFHQVLCNQPGQTQLAEHKIDTGSACPVRLQITACLQRRFSTGVTGDAPAGDN